jgi:hypothetical protein
VYDWALFFIFADAIIRVYIIDVKRFDEKIFTEDSKT